MANPEQLCFVPAGTFENSPALQCWVSMVNENRSPVRDDSAIC